jgi:uncharacterized membrane protein
MTNDGGWQISEVPQEKGARDRGSSLFLQGGAGVLIWAIILAFVVTFACLSVRRHLALATNGMDLGNVNQALWNTAHGNFMTFTNMAPVHSRLALHVEPILLLFVPFYWLGLGGPILLLIVQAAVVGLGALPLYWLARDRLLTATPAVSLFTLVFPAAYLLLPALEAAVMYDFHAVTLAPTFLLFAFYFMEKRRPGLFSLFAVLAMTCKEDMALTVVMLGLYTLLGSRRWRWGLPTMAAGIAWFAIAVFLVQPTFSPTGGNVQASRYAWLGGTPSAIAETFVRRPDLVWEHVWQQADLPAYLGGLLAPTALLAALSPLSWLPTLPSLAVNLLSNHPLSWRLEEFQYAAPIAPFVVISAVYGVRNLSSLVGRRWPAAGRYVTSSACGLLIVASLVYHWGRGFSPLAHPFQSWPVGDHEQHAEQVFRRSQVPPGAALFAQSNLNPHVSSRRVLYQEPAIASQMAQGAEPALGSGLPAPEYMLFDVSSLVNQDDFQVAVVARLMESGTFSPVLAEDGFLLLHKSSQPLPVRRDQLPDEFYAFARAGAAEPRYPVQANFGGQLRLLGFDLRFNRAEEVQPVLYFEALRSLDEDYFISLYLLDEWGMLRGATVVDQPALVWYPTHRWQPGERIRVTFNTLPWYTRNLPAYRLAVGVMRGRDPWQPAARLSPQLPAPDSTLYAVRLPGDGTLLELARFGKVFGMPDGGPLERQFRPPGSRKAANMSLGGQVRFLGYNLVPVTCEDQSIPLQRGNCWFGLVLYWQAQVKLAVDYKVFVHVVGPQSPSKESSPAEARIWAQRDALPDGGAYPTRRWVEGEVVADRVRVELPADMPTGSFDLVIGMYDPDTGRRLPVLDAADQPVDDKIVLEHVLAVPPARKAAE